MEGYERCEQTHGVITMLKSANGEQKCHKPRRRRKMLYHSFDLLSSLFKETTVIG